MERSGVCGAEWSFQCAVRVYEWIQNVEVGGSYVQVKYVDISPGGAAYPMFIPTFLINRNLLGESGVHPPCSTMVGLW